MRVLALRTSSQLVASLQLARGWGMAGEHPSGTRRDRRAQPGSPRQVLLVAAQVLADFGLQPGDLGENLLVSGDLADFASGQVWQVGAAARLRLMFRCEPCGKLNRLQPGLARRLGERRGWLAMVVASGTVRPGDRLTRDPQQFPALSDRPEERFAEFVARIPAGRVVRTPALLQGLGVLPAYSRVLPHYLRQAPPHLPRHRLVRADGRLFTGYIPDQAARLQAEGVAVAGDRLAAGHFEWPPACFHALDGEM